jgi:hypothetical protein
MKLAAHSRNKLLETFTKWRVDKDFADPMYNYLVHGFEPGSCFTSVLANDFFGAMTRSHPANTVEAFKALAKWIQDTVPAEARGSYEAVKKWTQLSTDERRTALEERRLIYTAEDETWLILKDVPTREPIIW